MIGVQQSTLAYSRRYTEVGALSVGLYVPKNGVTGGWLVRARSARFTAYFTSKSPELTHPENPNDKSLLQKSPVSET